MGKRPLPPAIATDELLLTWTNQNTRQTVVGIFDRTRLLKNGSPKVVTYVFTVFRVSEGLHMDLNIMLMEFQPLEIISRSLSLSFRETMYVLMR